MSTEAKESKEVTTEESTTEEVTTEKQETKFCKHCGEKIPKEAVVCTKCGLQVEDIKQDNNNIVINNSSSSSSNATAVAGPVKPKDKWTAFLLCLFLGFFGAHKFYEGKILLGVVYLLTGGLLGVGWIIDTIALFFKPNPYYV